MDSTTLKFSLTEQWLLDRHNRTLQINEYFAKAIKKSIIGKTNKQLDMPPRYH